MKIDLIRLSADASLTDFLRLRTELAEDQPGLLRLYRTVRELEFLHLGWPEETVLAMLESQMQIQSAQYDAMYPDLQRFILADRYGPAGRLLLAPQSGRVRLVDLSLLPAYQNRSVGSGLLRALQKQAEEQRCEIRVSVPSANPAIRLFLRLGFEDMKASGPQHSLRWLPGKNRF